MEMDARRLERLQQSSSFRKGTTPISKPNVLAKSFILNTISSIRNQRQKRFEQRKASCAVPRPWTNHLVAIGALVKRNFNKEEENLSIELSERDERVKSVVSGFLVIHVLEALKVFIASKSYLPGVPLCVYLVAKTGTKLRTSTVYSANNIGRIRLDYVFHFPIEISEWRDSPGNSIKVELWGFQDPEAHYFIGRMKEHVYQYIKDTHGIHKRPLLADDIYAGNIVYEFAFSYGSLGYGHSNQITNPDIPIQENVSHSMFPRIRPSNDDNITNKFAVRTPKRLHMMSMSSFILDMPKEGIVTRQGKKIDPAKLKEPKKIVIQKVDYEEGVPLHCHLNLKIWQTPIMADFNDTYGDYLCLVHRKERLQFLTDMSSGRKIDIREMEAGAIFEYMEDDVIEKVIKSERHTGTIIYPDDFHCPEAKHVVLGKEDEAFMDKFPSAIRTTGYLGVLFGWMKQDLPRTNNDMNYPAYLDAGRTRYAGSYGCSVFFFSIRDICRHVCKSIHSCFTFFFPDTVVQNAPVPEVSVRLPSPPDSTVNLYSYFIRPDDIPTRGNLTIQDITKKSVVLAEIQNQDAPNYGDILGMDAEQSEMTTATIKQSMADAHIVV